jgi:photosystem II stability/assembly factor-like uncharacterized protein
MHSSRTFFYICALVVLGVFGIHAEDSAGIRVDFERLGPFGGDVRSLLMDSQRPEVVYLGTSSGRIFKSLDAGISWSILFPGIGRDGYVVDTLVQHPVNPEHIYAGAWDLHSEGGGLFESLDAGLRWTQIELPAASVAVRGIAVSRSDPLRMLVGTLSGAFVSSDGGQSWKEVGGDKLQKARSVAIDPQNHRLLYVGTWRLAYKSTDFGETWTRLRKGMALDSDVFSISINRHNSQVVYSSACSGVYRSSNGAIAWTHLKLLPDRLNIRAHFVYIDPTNHRRVYGGTTEGLFVSSNEGRTWKPLTPKEWTINAIQVNPEDGDKILIGTEYEGIFRSEDAGKSWEKSNAGFIHKKISWILPEPSTSERFIAGVQSGAGGVYSFDASASEWQLSQIEPGLRILSFLILPNDDGRLAGTTQGIYWKAKDTDRWIKLKGSIARRTVYSLELDSQNPVIYAGTDQGIYRTSISAMDFRMPPGLRMSPKAWCIVSPANNPGNVYAGTSLGLLRTWDRGTTWNVISAYGLPSRVLIRAIAVSPSDREHLLAGTSVGLFESKNGGVHWYRSVDLKMGVDISSIVFLDQTGKRIVAADKTSGGIFYSRNSGQHWQKISAREYGSQFNCILKAPERVSQLYIGTQSDGVYRLSLP